MSSVQSQTESETELVIPSGWDPFEVWRKRVRSIEASRSSEERARTQLREGRRTGSDCGE